MVLTHKQCLERWHSDYQIKKMIANGMLYQIEKGIYADKPEVSTLAILSAKYPKGIVTMDSAFYYHGLTDVIPEEHHIATAKSVRTLRDARIRQVFVDESILNLGAVTFQHRDAVFRIYDQERMLIELLRYRKKLPFDYYKEIVGRYRQRLYELDIERIQEYAAIFPKSNSITEALEMEVF